MKTRWTRGFQVNQNPPKHSPMLLWQAIMQDTTVFHAPHKNWRKIVAHPTLAFLQNQPLSNHQPCLILTIPTVAWTSSSVLFVTSWLLLPVFLTPTAQSCTRSSASIVPGNLSTCLTWLNTKQNATIIGMTDIASVPSAKKSSRKRISQNMLRSTTCRKASDVINATCNF